MHELNYIWVNYFWASLKGNGPEALVQTLAYAAIAIAVIPVVRRFIRAEMAVAKGEIKKVDAEVKKLERDLLRPARWPWRLVKKMTKVRLTVKEVNDVAQAAEAVDPALTPEISAGALALGDLAAHDVPSVPPTPPPTTMSAQ